MKKSRIFATVIYFIFTFGIGIVFSLTLPGYFATFTAPVEVIEDALEEGDFVRAIVLTDPIGFKREPVLDCRFEGGGGVVLFETATEFYDRTSDNEKPAEGALKQGMIYKAYSGYVYGVADRYDVFSKTGNSTALRVTELDGEEKVLPLLDYDADGNGTNDGISTYTQSGFILLDIRLGEVDSIKKLVFTDKTGTEVLSAEPDAELSFSSTFFDCFGDIEAYNELVREGTAEGIPTDRRDAINSERNAYVDSVKNTLESTDGCALTLTSEEYNSAVEEVNHRSNGKAIPFIIIYFVAIYIIADFLLGTHFIIKFFKWFLFKVCKIPHKEKTSASADDVCGHDYYSMVTIKLDLSEAQELSGSVGIKYMSPAGEEFLFTLMKSEDYTATLRMKAGVYVNPYIDIDRAYGPLDLPDNLVVEGYQMEKIIKIGKRED